MKKINMSKILHVDIFITYLCKVFKIVFFRLQIKNKKQYPKMEKTIKLASYSLSDSERKMYKDQLNRMDGAIEKAATLSGIHRSTFYKVWAGASVKKQTLKKCTNAILKVITQINQASVK